MKLAIVGSRDFNSYHYLAKSIDVYFPLDTIDQIISGGAGGADSLAKRFATQCGIDYKEFPADWNTYGKSAGYRRNVDIVKSCDILVAYWDGKSNGTRHSINIALKDKKPILLFIYTERKIITFNWEKIINDSYKLETETVQA